MSSLSSSPLPSVSSPGPLVYIPLPARQFSTISKSEIALVIKMQLIQMQNQLKEGEEDDFYAMVLAERKRMALQSHRSGPRSHSSSQQPQKKRTLASVTIMQSRPAPSATASSTTDPLQTPSAPAPPPSSSSSPHPSTSPNPQSLFPRGTLGRFAASSLKKPKKLMELEPLKEHAVAFSLQTANHLYTHNILRFRCQSLSRPLYLFCPCICCYVATVSIAG